MGDVFNALSIDIGASNGRAVFGALSKDGTLDMQVVRRFPNGMSNVDGALRWDFDRLLSEVTGAVKECASKGLQPQSVGVTTWGVDYALIDEEGAWLDQPYAYRDKRNPPAMERFFAEVMPKDELYSHTGIQIMPFNTVYQLAAEVFAGGERLARAKRILLMPDALTYALCGREVAEYTIASTTQMLDAKTRAWSGAVLDKLGVDESLLPEVVEPGTVVGPCTVADGLQVVVPAGHDTAAAVAAVPAQGDEPWAYVSSGTWSLVGFESKTPVLTADALAAGVTNEGGVCGTYRLLSNVMGMWLLQECMRISEEAGTKLEITAVCEAAAAAPEGGPLIDPDHESFMAPDDMVKAISAFCERTKQPVPEGIGQLARCVFESLALKTRVVVERIGGLIGVDPKVVHIVGGGSRNTLLCQMTANALGRLVVAGPAEGTATGNFLMQALAAGRIKNLSELREVVRKNTELVRYEPADVDTWRERFAEFTQLLPG